MPFNPDFVVTAEARAADDFRGRARRVQNECRRRILAVADETTQLNFLAASSSGRMSEEDMAVYQFALDWKDAMVAHCRALALDPALEPDWPDLPEGVAALVEKY